MIKNNRIMGYSSTGTALSFARNKGAEVQFVAPDASISREEKHFSVEMSNNLEREF